MSETVEMSFPGVENTIRVPRRRVKNYRARGWKLVAPKRSATTDTSAESPVETTPGTGNDTKEA